MPSHKTQSRRPLLRISLKTKIEPLDYGLQPRAPKSNIAKKNVRPYNRPINIENNSPILRFNKDGHLTPVDKSHSRGGKSRSNNKHLKKYNKSKRLYK
jgi:hypothetical protein